MREICTSGSMSGEEKRSDGPLGERGNERPRAHSAPPVLHATALLLDSTIAYCAGGLVAAGFTSTGCPLTVARPSSAVAN